MNQTKVLARPNARIFLIGLASAVLYGWIAWLSFSFPTAAVLSDRPLMTVLLLFGAAFLAYLLACCETWRVNADIELDKPPGNADRRSRNTLYLVIGFGILFRIILLFSIPIQEIDLYRYILDGAVGNMGTDPFEFAPSEIVQAVDLLGESQWTDPLFARSDEERLELAQLAKKIGAKPGLKGCVEQIHFANYTSPYPPVSQAVFRIATRFVPDEASEFTWLVWMKATLTAFDILTGFLLIGLLKHCRLPAIMSLWYWWCPLVLKEIANSGHLDSIAVCLTVGFAWLAVASIWNRDLKSENATSYALPLSIGAAILLGLAVSAKIYPLVLAPVWSICLLRQKGIRGLLPVLVFCAVTAVGTWPILQRTSIARELNLVSIDTSKDDALVQERSEQLNDSNTLITRRPKAGIEVFSQYWEMNDLIFMFVVENVRPRQPTNGSGPWFLITSESWRTEFAQSMIDQYGFKEREFAFPFTRIVTLVMYVLLTVAFCLLAWRAKSSRDLLQLFFLSVAWFWLLSPTQNPWYWLWAMPFLLFVKRPIPWLLVSGTLFLYYLRFYFQHHYADEMVLQTQYHGQRFFDFVLPWIEFGSIFLLLLAQLIFFVYQSRTSSRAITQ